MSFTNYLKDKINDKQPQTDVAVEDIFKGEQEEIEKKILAQKVFSEKELLKFKSDFYKIPLIEAGDVEIDDSLRGLLAPNLITTYKMVPFAKDGQNIKVAISDPANLQGLQALEFLSKKNNWKPQLYLVSEKGLELLMQKSTGPVTDVAEAIKEFTVKHEEGLAQKKKPTEFELEIEEKAPIAKVVEGLISQALNIQASDIHIEPMEDSLRVRLRVDGVLKEVFSFPPAAQSAVIARIKILSNLKLDEQRLPQDGRFKFAWNNEEVDFRVSTFPVAKGEKIVMRALNKSDEIPNFESLGLIGQRQVVIEKAISQSHGMLLITGPTGSGKSTTLFVAMSQLNKPGVNIVTLEDPIEYVLSGVNQAQVNPEIGFTFASGLRSILRQDPNVILVGEIRDRETAELAVHSSLTGHVVFSTLHTNDAIGALPRLIDMGVEPFLIIASVNAIAAQRLVRRFCLDCRTETNPSAEVKKMISEELESLPESELKDIDLKNPKIYAPKGCKKCGNTGYKGRIGIFEAIEVSKEIGDLALAKASPRKLKEVARQDGMVTIRQDGFIKVLMGLTSVEEVLKETSE